jgi:hypothetical protein
MKRPAEMRGRAQHKVQIFRTRDLPNNTMRINVSSRENQIHNHFFLEELKKVGREAGVQGKGTENPTSLYTGDGTALTVPIFPAFLVSWAFCCQTVTVCGP